MRAAAAICNRSSRASARQARHTRPLSHAARRPPVTSRPFTRSRDAPLRPSLPSANVHRRRRRRRSLRVGEWGASASARCARVHVWCVRACVRAYIRACIACMLLAASRAPRRAERLNRYPSLSLSSPTFATCPPPPRALTFSVCLSLSPNLPSRLGTLGRSDRGARDRLLVTVAEQSLASATWSNPSRCSTAYRTPAC